MGSAVGPLLFLWWSFRGAVRAPLRHATAFALSGIAFHFLADMATVALLRLSFSSVLTATFFLSLAAKAAGALRSARLGQRRSGSNSAVRPEQSHE